MTGTLDASPYTLRPLRPEDGARVHALVNDWSVVRMLSHLPFPYPRELADRWITSTIQRQSANQAWHFAICEGDTLIGCVGLSLGHPGQAAKTGYWIGRSHWNRGIASLCVARVVSWAFKTLSIDEIIADAAEDNPASLALLRRLGFEETGKTRVPFLSRGADPCSVLTFALKRPLCNRTDTEMTSTPARILLVVAGILVDTQNRVLLARRPEGKPLAGLWEFPGGKVEPHESPEQALARELQEELGVDITAGCIAPFTFVSENVGGRHLLMPLYLCRRWRHMPHGREGQALEWVPVDRLHTYPMPAPDRPLIPLLRDLLSD